MQLHLHFCVRQFIYIVHVVHVYFIKNKIQSKFDNSKCKGPHKIFSNDREFELLRITKKSDMFSHFHSDNCMARLGSFNLDLRFKERCVWITQNQMMRNVQIKFNNFQLIFNQTWKLLQSSQLKTSLTQLKELAMDWSKSSLSVC